MIPSISECLNIMDKYYMMENIKAHSLTVTKVAYIITSFFASSGDNKKIQMEKVIAASLLHDIGKTEALKSGTDHTKTGVAICLENRFYEIAEIVAEHVILKHFDMKSPCTEKEIVYYSDKRVNHDKVVSLDERLSYIIERYGRGDPGICQAIKRNFTLCRKVENKIFNRASLSPEDISRLIDYVIIDEKSGLIRWQKKISYLK